MKKGIVPFLLILTTLIVNKTVAQSSRGGQPYSFQKGNLCRHAINFVNMPPFDIAALEAEDLINDKNKGPFRFGYNHQVNLNTTNSGIWLTLTNGDRLWQLGIKSTGATSINLAFDNFYLPVGATLFIYNDTKKYIIGAFTNQNNQADKAFATDLIPGEAVILEYYEPKEVANKGQLNLFRVTHGYREIQKYLKSFGDAESCQMNVNCPIGDNWQKEKRSVLLMVIGGNEFCSGALINNVSQNGKPYVLTASHCGFADGTWIFRFNWEAPNCANPSSSPPFQSLSGGIQKVIFTNTDCSLVEITGGLDTGKIPRSYKPYFSGWSNLNAPADSVWGIHHPSVDIKKISHAPNACISDTFEYSAPDGVWKIGQWTIGCTEPGSSGSPLYDQNHHIVGQLMGGPSYCGAPDTVMYDYYGKFSLSWTGGGYPFNQLKHWLDPFNTDSITLDGYEPYKDSLITDGYDPYPESVKNKLDISVYPNPSNGNFEVAWHLTNTQEITIKVMNILGEIVLIKNVPNSTIAISTIDLTDKEAGLYFVEVSTPVAKNVKKISLIK